MADPASTASTLPSLATAMTGLRPQEELLATIIFHPDLSRVGDYAVVRRSRTPTLLGREAMGFKCAPDADEGYLAEPYVSRRALCLEFTDQGLLLQRDTGASRCRVNGLELERELLLDKDALTQGVAIMLAHTVVLWLAYGQARQTGGEQPDFGLVGSGRYTQSLREQIAQVAAVDMDVLLRGATGTGKEVVARAIHAASGRSRQALVNVNVAAIPSSLAAAALFGAAKGAFTGADRARRGYFQQAAGGTLFLDEIGDAPAEVQPQLLRALQEREIQCVGGDTVAVDLRVISATDAAIEARSGGFSAALRHRLGALEITLQTLASHREDIGELLNHFLGQAFSAQGRAALLTGPDSSARQVAAWAGFYYACLRYGWPGNVRQLQNVCRQVAVASRTALVLPAPVIATFAEESGQADSIQASAAAVRQRLRHITDVTEEEFARAMRELEHEVRPVARRLNVSRQAVYRKIAADARYRLAADVSAQELESALAQFDGDTEQVARQLQVSPSGLRARLRQERAQPGAP